jgi:hypothetical protein
VFGYILWLDLLPSSPTMMLSRSLKVTRSLMFRLLRDIKLRPSQKISGS